jgi:hypothetical protein
MPSGAARLGFRFINASPPLPDPEEPIEQFDNLGFEQGISGWTVAATRIRFGGLSVLAGFPTPVDPLPNPFGSPGDATSVDQLPNFRYTLDTVDKPPLGEVQSMHLYMGDIQFGVVNEGASMFGPAIYSNFFVNFDAGDSCSFDWKALPGPGGTGGGDAYSIYAYMVEQTTGNYITLLRAAGANSTAGTTWSTRTVNIDTAGAYKFVFVAGSWDSTYGTVIGGQMLIDNIRRIQP